MNTHYIYTHMYTYIYMHPYYPKCWGCLHTPIMGNPDQRNDPVLFSPARSTARCGAQVPKDISAGLRPGMNSATARRWEAVGKRPMISGWGKSSELWLVALQLC